MHPMAARLRYGRHVFAKVRAVSLASSIDVRTVVLPRMSECVRHHQ